MPETWVFHSHRACALNWSGWMVLLMRSELSQDKTVVASFKSQHGRS